MSSLSPEFLLQTWLAGTGNSGEGYPDSSDCRKLREGDYDNKQEKAELEADCAEDRAEEANDDDHSGSGSSGSGSSGSDSSGSGREDD